MSPFSIFPNRVVQSRSLLKKYVNSYNLGPPINRRMYRSHSSGESALFLSHQPERPLSSHMMTSESSQRRQLNSEQRYVRQNLSSSNVTTQESLSDTKEDAGYGAKMKTSKLNIDPNEEEVKRRQVKDVSVIKY